MSLQTTFIKAADTVFKVFDSLTHAASYVRVANDGWGTITETLYSIKVIMGSFTQEDVHTLSFSSLIQPTDIKGLVKGNTLPTPLKTTDLVRITASGRELHVVAWDTDPAGAVYIILLREV